ncbi:MAG: hypothetical protein ACYTFY_00210 [Planctomycetota bacterium]|jgi:hypothetical protein
MAEDFDEDFDDLDFDVEEENQEEAEDFDFDEEDDDAGSSYKPAGGGSKSDVYTAMLIISAAFYIIALLATFAEMAPYCKDFLGGLF